MTVSAPLPFQNFFGVAAELSINDGAIVVQNLNDDSFRLAWKVKKSIKKLVNVAEVIIYNLPQIDRDQLSTLAQTVESTRVGIKFSIGWEGQVMQVFDGFATTIEASRLYSTHDAISSIHMKDGSFIGDLEVTKDNKLVGNGVLILLGKACRDAGLKFDIPTVKATVAKASGKLTFDVFGQDGRFKKFYMGQPLKLIDGIMETLRLSWGVDGQNLIVYEDGVNNDALPIELGPGTGLIKCALKDKGGGYEIEAYAIPTCVAGQQVTVFDNDGSTIAGGPMRVESVEFSGDTDDKSTMKIVAKVLKPPKAGKKPKLDSAKAKVKK